MPFDIAMVFFRDTPFLPRRPFFSQLRLFNKDSSTLPLLDLFLTPGFDCFPHGHGVDSMQLNILRAGELVHITICIFYRCLVGLQPLACGQSGRGNTHLCAVLPSFTAFPFFYSERLSTVLANSIILDQRSFNFYLFTSSFFFLFEFQRKDSVLVGRLGAVRIDR